MMRLGIITLVCTVLGVTTVEADSMYTVTLPTTSLIGNANGPFVIDFQMTSGSTSSGIVNVAAISSVTTGANGSLGSLGPFPTTGNVSGNLSSTLVLSTANGTFFSEYSQMFLPGSSLQFQLRITNNAQQASGSPDEFSMSLIDTSNTPVLTTDPSGGHAVLVIDFGQTAQVGTFSTKSDGITIMPTVVATVPEPTVASSVLCGSLLLLLFWRLMSHRVV